MGDHQSKEGGSTITLICPKRILTGDWRAFCVGEEVSHLQVTGHARGGTTQTRKKGQQPAQSARQGSEVTQRRRRHGDTALGVQMVV